MPIQPFPHVITPPPGAALRYNRKDPFARIVAPQLEIGQVIRFMIPNGTAADFIVSKIVSSRLAAGDWIGYPSHPNYYEAEMEQQR